VEYTADEVASGMLSPPGVVEAGDLAPVLATFPLAALATIFVAIPAGGGGAPDDVEVWPLNGLPFQFRVLDAVAYVTTAVGASTLELRDEAAGAGNLLASAASAATGRQANTAAATGSAVPGASKGLFVRRSDSGVAAELVVTIRREM